MRQDTDPEVARLLERHTPDAPEAPDWASVRRRARRPGGRLRRGTRWIPAAIGVAVLAALIGALLVAAPGEEPVPRGVLSAPAAALADGRIWVQRDEAILTTVGRGGFFVSRWTSATTTLTPSGRTDTVLELGRAALTRPQDEAAWRAAGSPDLEGLVPRSGDVAANSPQTDETPEHYLGAGNQWLALTQHLGADPLPGLPVGPVELRALLMRLAWVERQISGDPLCSVDLSDCPPDQLRVIRDRYFDDLVNLLRYPLTPPDVAQRVRGVLASEQGVTTIGPRTDARGRAGVALLLPEQVAGGQDVVLLDPATARLLATGTTSDRADPARADDRVGRRLRPRRPPGGCALSGAPPRCRARRLPAQAQHAQRTQAADARDGAEPRVRRPSPPLAMSPMKPALRATPRPSRGGAPTACLRGLRHRYGTSRRRGSGTAAPARWPPAGTACTAPSRSN